MTANYNPELQRNYYRDLKNRGLGCPSTVWRKVRAGRFPEPIKDESERPYWTDAMLIEHQEDLIRRREAESVAEVKLIAAEAKAESAREAEAKKAEEDETEEEVEELVQ